MYRPAFDGVGRFHQHFAQRGMGVHAAGNLFMSLWPQMTANLAAFVAVSSAYFYLGSIPEENKLIGEFGDAYRHYQRAVPRMIPRPGRVYLAEG